MEIIKLAIFLLISLFIAIVVQNITINIIENFGSRKGFWPLIPVCWVFFVLFSVSYIISIL